MLEALKEIEKEDLLDLLDKQIWYSLDVDYHPPRVERVWTQLGEKRLSLHVIHPCKDGEALWHPHAWASAFHVLPIGGIYEQGVGRGSIDPLISLKHKFEPYMKMEVTGNMYYEMIHVECAHYVRPINDPVYTVMLSGPALWTENSIKSDKILNPLKAERVDEILKIFKNYYK